MIDPAYPLIELHRHLDGNVRLETIFELGQQYNLPLPAKDIESLRPFVQVTTPQPDILAFFAKFQWQTIGMVNPAACRRIAYENVLDAKRERIACIELRFSPWFMAETHKLDPAAVTEAVVDGALAGARDTSVRVNLIGILSRTYGADTAWKELDALLTQKDAITALDLAGDEIHFPGSLFVEHFKKARNAGWHITIHAGEVAGPASVWQALRELGAERIGHAVHAPEDPALIDFLREHAIPVESNLTSNVQTSTVKDYPSHPLRFFLEQGVCATINSDDPGISAIDLPYEYNVAAPKAGLTPTMIRQAQHNALQAVFLTAQEKADLIRSHLSNIKEK